MLDIVPFTAFRVTSAVTKPPKIQRWVDLLAALLRRQYPVTFDQLIDEVPAYRAEQKPESRRGTFERDKLELRKFGVPIETVENYDGEVPGYQLRVRDFYLPYLALRSDAAGGTTHKPRVIDRYGYRSLPTLTFEPDELAAVAAAARARQLGDPLLAEHAESAMRKLACDVPVDAGRGTDRAPPRLLPDPSPGRRGDPLAGRGGAPRRSPGGGLGARRQGSDQDIPRVPFVERQEHRFERGHAFRS
jgi:hypothetical protein